MVLEAFKELREFEREIEKEVQKLENKIILNNIEPFFQELVQKYSAYSAIKEYLEKVKEDLLKILKNLKIIALVRNYSFCRRIVLKRLFRGIRLTF